MTKLTQIGPYELVRRLGTGGMAETYLARRRGPGNFTQDLCLKLILPEHARKRQFLDAFQDEAKLQAALRHSNIVQVYDFGEADDTYYLALELVEGSDLRDLLSHLEERSALLPQAVAVLIAMELTRALEHAHKLTIDGALQHLVHRDLSPSNVLVSLAGDVKLTDFGIAKARDRNIRTESGATKGKLTYMSPEQLEDPRAVDARTDLFALGVVMYELLAGVHPFRLEGGSDAQVITSITRGARTPLATSAPHVAGGLCSLVDSLLAAKASDRPQSASEVLQRLASFAPPTTARDQLAKFVAAVRDPSAINTVVAAASIPRTPPKMSARPAGSPPPEYVPTQPLPSRSSEPVPRPKSSPADAPTRTRSARRRSRSPWPWVALAFATAVAVSVMIVARLEQQRRTEPPQTPMPSARAAVARQNVAPVQVTPSSGDATTPPKSLAPTAAQASSVVAEPSTLNGQAPGEPRPEENETAKPRSQQKRARLRVVAIPFGRIWIDGVERGPSPVELDLTPARHTVAAGRENTPSKTLTVRLAPGERKEVELNL